MEKNKKLIGRKGDEQIPYRKLNTKIIKHIKKYS